MERDEFIRFWQLHKMREALREYAQAVELLERDFEDERLRAREEVFHQ